jgi:hypothetical protein
VRLSGRGSARRLGRNRPGGLPIRVLHIRQDARGCRDGRTVAAFGSTQGDSYYLASGIGTAPCQRSRHRYGIDSRTLSLGLTPTASIAVMSAIADALALVVMERRDFSRKDYGLRHHGGYLGAKARVDNT